MYKFLFVVSLLFGSVSGWAVITEDEAAFLQENDITQTVYKEYQANYPDVKLQEVLEHKKLGININLYFIGGKLDPVLSNASRAFRNADINRLREEFRQNPLRLRELLHLSLQFPKLDFEPLVRFHRKAKNENPSWSFTGYQGDVFSPPILDAHLNPTPPKRNLRNRMNLYLQMIGGRLDPADLLSILRYHHATSSDAFTLYLLDRYGKSPHREAILEFLKEKNVLNSPDPLMKKAAAMLLARFTSLKDLSNAEILQIMQVFRDSFILQDQFLDLNDPRVIHFIQLARGSSFAGLPTSSLFPIFFSAFKSEADRCLMPSGVLDAEGLRNAENAVTELRLQAHLQDFADLLDRPMIYPNGTVIHLIHGPGDGSSSPTGRADDAWEEASLKTIAEKAGAHYHPYRSSVRSVSESLRDKALEEVSHVEGPLTLIVSGHGCLSGEISLGSAGAGLIPSDRGTYNIVGVPDIGEALARKRMNETHKDSPIVVILESCYSSHLARRLSHGWNKNFPSAEVAPPIFVSTAGDFYREEGYQPRPGHKAMHFLFNELAEKANSDGGGVKFRDLYRTVGASNYLISSPEMSDMLGVFQICKQSDTCSFSVQRH